MQIVLYSNAPEIPSSDDPAMFDAWVEQLLAAQWGWRYQEQNSGLVFATRDAAVGDAVERFPGVGIG